MRKLKFISAFLAAVTAASMMMTTASATLLGEGDAPVFDVAPTVEGHVERIHTDLGDGYGQYNNYYVDENGEPVKGYSLLYIDFSSPQEIGSRMRLAFVDKETGEILSNHTGFTRNKTGRRYYLKGERIYGWYKIGNYWYHFDEKGYADTGRTRICGAYYTFDKKGRWTGKVSKNGVAPKDFTLEWTVTGMQSFNTDGNIFYGEGWKDDGTGDAAGDLERYEQNVKFSGKDRQIMYCMFLESGFSQGGEYRFSQEYMDNAIKERDFGDAEEIAESYVSEHETIYTVTVTMNGETTKIRYSTDLVQINHLDENCFRAFLLTRNLRDYRNYCLFMKYPRPENIIWDIFR